MTLLAAAPFRRTLPLAALALALFGASAHAQIQLTHTEDASPIPVGMVRLRVTTGFTRYNELFGDNGRTPVGTDLSADPLGTRQFPLLAPIESSIQSLAADPRMRLSLGRLVTRGDARIVTTPIALEYGLTRRLSVGVVVPVVQARRTVTVDVNSATGMPANVGFVSPLNRNAAATQNAAAAASYTAAAQQLSDLVARCQASPSSSGCSAVNADPNGAAAAAALARQFAAAAAVLGTTSGTALIAPRANGTVAIQIEQQRLALNRQLQQYLGASATQTSPVYFATTDFSYIDLQGRNGTPGFLQSSLAGGLDSIRTTERIGVGDISVGAQFLVFDKFQHDTLPLRGLQTRLAIGAAARFATGRPDTVTNLVDIGTGEGAAVEVRSALDLIAGRVGGTIATRYVKSFARTVWAPLLGDPESGFPLPAFGARERTMGDVFGVDITPRYLLSETFAIDAHYGLERTGATTFSAPPAMDEPLFCGAIVNCGAPLNNARTAQRLGVGLRYSTVDAYSRGAAPYPFEVSYTHLETVSGDPGVAKLAREQIQVRLFYRLFGR